MSSNFYSKFWVATKNDLRDTLLIEKVLTQMEATTNRNLVQRILGELYARYIVLQNNLSDIYDQTLQAQKRQITEKLLVLVTKRLLEWQNELKTIQMSEFLYVDNSLMELRFIPQEIEFLTLHHLANTRESEVQDLLNLHKRKVETREEFSKIDAANLLRIHEKARQARVLLTNFKLNPEKFKFKRHKINSMTYEFSYGHVQQPLIKVKRTNFARECLPGIVHAENETTIKEVLKNPSQENLNSHNLESQDNLNVYKKYEDQLLEISQKKNKAASTIQKFYKSYKSRKLIESANNQRKSLCGIVEDNNIDVTTKIFNDVTRKKRRQRMSEFDRKLENAVNDNKMRILKYKSRCIMEDITEEIRVWFREFYDATKTFPKYPDSLEGGTILLVQGRLQTAEEFLEAKNKTDDQKKREKEQKAKLKEKAEKKKLQEEAKKRQDEMKKNKITYREWDFSDAKYHSKTIVELSEYFEEHDRDWFFIKNTKSDEPIKDLIKLQNYAEVHQELRKNVDEAMKLELELLRAALAEDKRTKYKKSKAKKSRKPKRKPKTPKKKIDITEGRDLQECFEELRNLNIIREYPRRKLEDFIGDFNYTAFEERAMFGNPEPCYGDIRKALRPLIIGMGPLKIPKPRSICLLGPPKCGKKFLIEALCSEMDAVVFDLSAEKIAPIENMNYFINFVNSMARKLQPTVLFIDDCHKPFIKKIPAQDKDEDPRKLGKYLLKSIVKTIKADDRVMVMGCSNQPWNCKIMKFKRCFERIITIPPTLDYNTTFLTWKIGLQKHDVSNFDVSCIARLTMKYSVADILEIIDEEITLDRRLRFFKDPLTSRELLNYFYTYGKKSLPENEIKKFHKIYLKLDKFSKKLNSYNKEMINSLKN